MDSEAYTNYVGRSEQNTSQGYSPIRLAEDRNNSPSQNTRKRNDTVDLVRPEAKQTKRNPVDLAGEPGRNALGSLDKPETANLPVLDKPLVNPESSVNPLLRDKQGKEKKRESVNIFNRFVNATQAWEEKADGKLDGLTRGVDDTKRLIRGVSENLVTGEDLGDAVKRIQKAVSGKSMDDKRMADLVADRLVPLLKRVAKGLEQKQEMIVAGETDLEAVKSTNALEERVEELESNLARVMSQMKSEARREPVLREKAGVTHEGGEATVIHGSRPLQLGGASMEVWMVQNDVKKLRDDLMTVNKAVGNLFWYLYGRDRKGRNLTLHGKERTDGFYAVQVYENKEKRYKIVQEGGGCGDVDVDTTQAEVVDELNTL